MPCYDTQLGISRIFFQKLPSYLNVTDGNTPIIHKEDRYRIGKSLFSQVILQIGFMKLTTAKDAVISGNAKALNYWQTGELAGLHQQLRAHGAVDDASKFALFAGVILEVIPPMPAFTEERDRAN